MSEQFARQVLNWFAQHGRKDLPWQHNPTAYRVWVSEIMLQQTQVTTVIPYYQRFMHSFPDLNSLADAPLDKVLQHWSGLGYYARARNLHKTAKICQQNYDGQLPDNLDELVALAGIGLSTAGAILALSAGQYQTILDGNVKRVLSRYHKVEGWSGKAAVLKKLWALARQHTPEKNTAAYTQAMMDLGATVCTRSRPNCRQCPLNQDCLAYKHDCVKDYPNPKPRKVLPQKQRRFLVLENADGAFLLHKRPEKGIWGGLWSFIEYPENQPLENLTAWCLQHLNIEIQTPHIGTEYKHTLTHFHMMITPIHIKLSDDRPIEWGDLQPMCWYTQQQPFEGGLSAPVTQLLNQLEREPCHAL